MSRRKDWFSETPPAGHTENVLKRAQAELEKNRVANKAVWMPWFLSKRWMFAYSALAAIAVFTLYLNYQEEYNLQDKAGVLAWSEELGHLDMETISEVDLREDMEMLEELDTIRELQQVDWQEEET